CLGIYGLCGSGKSDLVRMLTGLAIFDDGNFYLNKFDSNQGPLKQLEGISCAPQFNCYHEILTIEEMLILFAKIRRVEDSQILPEVRLVGSIFQLTSKFKVQGCKLDEFTKRALTLATAFIGKPHLVIIDDPTHQVRYLCEMIIFTKLFVSGGPRHARHHTKHDSGSQAYIQVHDAFGYKSNVRSGSICRSNCG